MYVYIYISCIYRYAYINTYIYISYSCWHLKRPGAAAEAKAARGTWRSRGCRGCRGGDAGHRVLRFVSGRKFH